MEEEEGFFMDKPSSSLFATNNIPVRVPNEWGAAGRGSCKFGKFLFFWSP